MEWGLAQQPACLDDAESRFEREALPHRRDLQALAWRLTGNTADAEDLVQEALLRAFRAFGRFAPGTNIRAWLFTILYRVRIDNVRKAARAPRTVELLKEGPAVAPTQNELALGQELVRRALDRLPTPFRDAVVLRDVQDLSYQEIAAMTGVPVGTVMSRIHRGRTQLRGMLREAHA